MRDLELAEIKSMLASEAERTEEMQSAAELALRALDAQLADGKWSTVVTPPDGTQPGHTFQWMDATKGINATAVTVPADWVGGPVLVRLHRTPVAPRLPAPSLGAPPPLRPLRNPFGDAAPLAGVADTRPVNFSEEWKSVFKAAGVRKQDLSDPVKAMRIALALAESWDVRAALPEMPGFTDKLGPLASLSLGPRGAVADGDADCHADGEAHAEELVVAPTEAAEPAEANAASGSNLEGTGGPLAAIGAELQAGKAALKARAGGGAPSAAADGMADALNQIKKGAFQLRSAADAPKVKMLPGKGGTDDVLAEMRQKPIKLRSTGKRTTSGKAIIPAHSERGGGHEGAQVGLPGVRSLKKPQHRPEPPREMSELDKVRERMAKKMQERLRQMEEDDVAASWDDASDEQAAMDALSALPAGGDPEIGYGTGTGTGTGVDAPADAAAPARHSEPGATPNSALYYV